jgi:NAD(P)-dependent dehydrogenase (short-subunit alcohol dehydrogenase family)
VNIGGLAAHVGAARRAHVIAAKAGLVGLTKALAHDLAPHGVSVSLINPGFVRTPLTAHNGFHMPALQTPEQAAEAIVRGWRSGRFEIHFPWRFTWVLKIMQPLAHGLYLRVVSRILGG